MIEGGRGVARHIHPAMFSTRLDFIDRGYDFSKYERNLPY